LEQIRQEATEWESRRDNAKADSKADANLSATRKLLQEASAKRDELIRESLPLEPMLERLKAEGEQLTRGVDQIRQEVTQWERRRDAAKAASMVRRIYEDRLKGTSLPSPEGS
jgi:uncharacterized protein